MFICTTKFRDRYNNIKGYSIKDCDSGEIKNITPIELKQMMHRGLKVENLKLTSDNRIINDDDYLKKQALINSNKKRIIEAYNMPGSENKLKYVLKKINSHRVGRLMTRALIIGLTTASLATITTGCGSTAQMDVNATQIEQQVELSLQDKLDLLNSASKIDVDIKTLSLTSEADISVDGTDIGTISGKFIKLFDTLTFTDDDGNQISKGDQNAHLIADSWIIYDSNDNPIYAMRQDLVSFTKKYIISDMDGNDVAWLKKDFWTTTNSGVIYDMDDNVIAEINQSFLRNDFSIEVKEGCNIDNTSLTTISVNYMMTALESKSHKSSNNKSEE